MSDVGSRIRVGGGQEPCTGRGLVEQHGPAGAARLSAPGAEELPLASTVA
jgi:hypothetical protein